MHCCKIATSATSKPTIIKCVIGVSQVEWCSIHELVSSYLLPAEELYYQWIAVLEISLVELSNIESFEHTWTMHRCTKCVNMIMYQKK